MTTEHEIIERYEGGTVIRSKPNYYNVYCPTCRSEAAYKRWENRRAV